MEKIKGKDLKLKSTTIELKGQKYNLNFDLNAMAELEEKYETIHKAIAELKKKKLAAVRAFLYAVLKSTDESLTEFEVGKLIDVNNFNVIEKAITELISNAFEEDSGEIKEEKNEQANHQE